MRTLFLLAAIACFTTATRANVWTTVYRYDGKTPLAAADPNDPSAYRGIMTGTHLTIVVSSDHGGYWWGGLLVPWEDVGHSLLTGRGFVPIPIGYPDSCLPAAGIDAAASPFMGLPELGVEFSSTYDIPIPGYDRAVPGDWFIFDYFAERVGSCRLQFHDLDYYAQRDSLLLPKLDLQERLDSFDMPLQTLSFTQVPTRDFNGDKVVDLQDFALLASQWRSTSASAAGDPDATPDLDASGGIDANDLTLFTDFWLERTDAEPVDDPNAQ